jgi:hypothetical protein
MLLLQGDNLVCQWIGKSNPCACTLRADHHRHLQRLHEQDRLVAAGILNRMRRQGPEGARHHTVRSDQSMNGIIIHSNRGNKRPLGLLVARIAMSKRLRLYQSLDR